MNPRAVLIGFMVTLAALALLANLVAALLEPEEPEPKPIPGYHPECTQDDVADGACLTWDDIREQPLKGN